MRRRVAGTTGVAASAAAVSIDVTAMAHGPGGPPPDRPIDAGDDDARRFTLADRDEITRFLRAPVGRKHGDLYPQVIAEGQARRAAMAWRYPIEASRGIGQ